MAERGKGKRGKAQGAGAGVPVGGPARRVTITDVAAAANLSVTQVSRALADYSDVSHATRQRVRHLAEQMGYRPSQRARSLGLGSRASKRCLTNIAVTS